MEEPKKDFIHKLTVKEYLLSEYNEHIVNYVKSLIETTFTSGRPQDEVVLTLIQPSGNPQIPQMERKIKAKEAQEKARKEMDKQDSVLRAIERLMKEEDKKETKFD